MSELTHCSGCGTQIHVTAPTCPSCGALRMGTKNKIIAGLLALFLGGFGIHKFYLGSIGLGILYLACTIIGPFLLFIPNLIIGIVAFVEAIVYFCSSDENFNRKYNMIKTQ